MANGRVSGVEGIDRLGEASAELLRDSLPFTGKTFGVPQNLWCFWVYFAKEDIDTFYSILLKTFCHNVVGRTLPRLMSCPLVLLYLTGFPNRNTSRTCKIQTATVEHNLR